jgi:hypothetical protein
MAKRKPSNREEPAVMEEEDECKLLFSVSGSAAEVSLIHWIQESCSIAEIYE